MTEADALSQRHATAFADTMRPWSPAEFTDLLDAPHTHLIDTGHAFALTRIVADEAELLTLATDPAHRRKGMARALLRALENHAREAGATTLFLEVSANNTPAIALYDAAGYQTTSRRPKYYQSPTGMRVDALILTKAL